MLWQIAQLLHPSFHLPAFFSAPGIRRRLLTAWMFNFQQTVQSETEHQSYCRKGLSSQQSEADEETETSFFSVFSLRNIHSPFDHSLGTRKGLWMDWAECTHYTWLGLDTSQLSKKREHKLKRFVCVHLCMCVCLCVIVCVCLWWWCREGLASSPLFKWWMQCDSQRDCIGAVCLGNKLVATEPLQYPWRGMRDTFIETVFC